MSAKERAHNFRHERKSSCRPSCFSCSYVNEHDNGDLESTSDSSTSKLSMISRKPSWFSWSRLRKRKKESITEVHRVPINPLSQETHKAIGKKSMKKPQQEISIASDQTTTLPHISVKYNTRSQPNQTQTRSKPTIQTDSPETNQQSIDPASHSSQRIVPKLRPVVGLSLLVATLATMLMFGRAFAIAWLFACFYLLPLLKTAMIATEGGNGTEENIHAKVDTESKEYKKKVVLEGLLERDGKRLSKVQFGKGLPRSGGIQ